jgi:hypothetical protein
MVNLSAALRDSWIMTKTMAKKRDAIVAGGTGSVFRTARAGEGTLCRGKLLPAAALRLDSPRGGAYLNGYVAWDSFFDFLVIAPRPGAGAHDPRGPVALNAAPA